MFRKIKKPSGEATQNRWLDQLYVFWLSWIIPAGVFCMLTGFFWGGSHSDYPQIVRLSLLLPSVLLIILRPAALWDALQSPVFCLILVFCTLSMFSVFWGGADQDVLSLLKRPVFVLLMCVAVMELSSFHQGRLRVVVLCAMGVAAACAALWLGRYFYAGLEARFSGYGTLSNPLMVSHVFGFFAAIALANCAGRRSFWELCISVIAVAVCSALVVSTGSRTPLVALAATIVWLLCIAAGPRTLVMVGIASLVSLIVFVLWPSLFLERGLSYRPQIWANVLSQIGDNPWFGHGFGMPIRIDVAGLAYTLSDPHNLTLAVLFDLGIVGGIIWLMIYGLALRLSWKYRHQTWVVVCSAAVVYGLFSGMTEGGAYLSRPKEHWFVVWIPLALLAASLRQCDRAEQRGA